MTPLSISIVVVGFGAIALVGVALLQALRPRPVDRHALSHEGHLLRKRLEHLRMGRMLQRHHIAEDRYFRELPLPVIAGQLAACAACSQVLNCSQHLAYARAPGLEPSFCPNCDTVLALSRKAA